MGAAHSSTLPVRCSPWKSADGLPENETPGSRDNAVAKTRDSARKSVIGLGDAHSTANASVSSKTSDEERWTP